MSVEKSYDQEKRFIGKQKKNIGINMTLDDKILKQKKKAIYMDFYLLQVFLLWKSLLSPIRKITYIYL